MKTAILFGATGMIGHELISRLLNDPRYKQVKVFTRTTIKRNNLNIAQHIVDFDNFKSFKDLLVGDDVFCCIGTTMRNAKTKEAFRSIDYYLVMKLAQAALEKGAGKFIVVSSIGANPSSRNFYLRTKGEMERDVQQLGYHEVKILRPSILAGKRKEFRPVEKVSVVITTFLSPVLPAKLRPVSAETLAKAMIVVANREIDQVIFESNEIQKLGR